MTSKKTWRTVLTPEKKYTSLEEIRKEIDEIDETNPKWYLVPTKIVSKKTGQQLYCIGQPYEYRYSRPRKSRQNMTIRFRRFMQEHDDDPLILHKDKEFKLLQIKNPAKEYGNKKCISYGRVYDFQESRSQTHSCFDCFSGGTKRHTRKNKFPNNIKI